MHSAVPNSTLACRTVHGSICECGAVPNSTLSCRTVHGSICECGAVPNSTLSCRTVHGSICECGAVPNSGLTAAQQQNNRALPPAPPPPRLPAPAHLQVGESEPVPFFYQNLGEAEYLVSLYCFMRLLGYPAAKISVLTTYNGQKALLRDVFERRCANNPLYGRPSKVGGGCEGGQGGNEVAQCGHSPGA